MNIIRNTPPNVVELEHVEIPMPDGCRLAARIWMPEGAADQPVPAILEYLPYRKNDNTHARDAERAPYIAARGYAYVRLDLRGCGESEGVMFDEYLPQELEDGCDAIEWIAAQPWCDGGVGIVGISWGGFNGLQLAALQPPALKAVVTICSTDDRYADDIHYMGGTMLVEQMSWASTMFGINTLPPDPRHVGARWRDMWRERLAGSGLWLKNWLEHQTRDEFWKHGSICEDYGKVETPVYAVSGWADGYCRTVFRLMENLSCPRKGLVGPWAHKYPHMGEPGPAINWLDEELRWWDQWLKGVETGIMDEPQLRLFMQDNAPPAGAYETREGRWVEEPSWPSPSITPTAFSLGADGTLGVEGAPDEPLTISSPLRVGLAGGKWCSYGNPGDQPVEQSIDDGGSLVFETAPLDEALEIAGDPALDLSFEVDRPVALVAVRLVDVAPDDAATRVSYGLLNLTHRDSHETPEPLEPGRRYRARVPLKHVAQRFARGHRIRLAVSSNYFPVAWPAPEPVTLTIHPRETALELPVRRSAAPDPAPFGPAQAAPAMASKTIAPPEFAWRVVDDLASGETRVEIVDDDGTFRIEEAGLTVSAQGTETYSFAGEDLRSVRGEIVWRHGMSRGDWAVSTLTRTELTATESHFIVKAKLTAWEGDEIAHEQEWDEAIPRRLV